MTPILSKSITYFRARPDDWGLRLLAYAFLGVFFGAGLAFVGLYQLGIAIVFGMVALFWVGVIFHFSRNWHEIVRRK